MEWSSEGYLALSALNVKNGYIDHSVKANYGDINLYKRWMKNKELLKGEVLFTTEAPMGNVAQVPDNKCYILSQRTISFKVNKNRITDDFLFFLLKSSDVIKNLNTLSSGATAKGISQKSLKQLYVNIPFSIEEQQKIADFFLSLNTRVNNQKTKVNLIKYKKKALITMLLI